MDSEANYVKDNVLDSPHPGEAAGTESVRLFEANKRLLKQLETVRDELNELKELLNPTVFTVTIKDCSDKELHRRLTGGWTVEHYQFVHMSMREVILCVVFKKVVEPDPPTPLRKIVPVQMQGTDNAHSGGVDEADVDGQTAAVIPSPAHDGNMIKRVMTLPTLLPTHDKAELNRIAVMNAVRRTQEQFRDYQKVAPRPADIIEGSLA